MTKRVAAARDAATRIVTLAFAVQLLAAPSAAASYAEELERDPVLVLNAFASAVNARDTDRALASLADDVLIADERGVHQGQGVDAWLARAAAEGIHLQQLSVSRVKGYEQETHGRTTSWWWLGWTAIVSRDRQRQAVTDLPASVGSAVVEGGRIHLLSLQQSPTSDEFLAATTGRTPSNSLGDRVKESTSPPTFLLVLMSAFTVTLCLMSGRRRNRAGSHATLMSGRLMCGLHQAVALRRPPAS